MHEFSHGPLVKFHSGEFPPPVWCSFDVLNFKSHNHPPCKERIVEVRRHQETTKLGTTLVYQLSDAFTTQKWRLSKVNNL